MAGRGVLTLAAAAETLQADGSRHLPELRSGRYVRLTVSDTGAGMDRATLSRATEPFFTTKPVGKGTGLGLAMTRGFAEQSGGGLHIESTPGRGTVVRLWFPVADEAAPLPDSRLKEANASERNRSARLLMVDDDALVCNVVAGQMKAIGYTVLAADSGSAALVLLDAGEAVDLMITDLSMPTNMDGG